MSGYEKLLKGVKYGKLNLRNRIFMSSMNRCRADESTGGVTPMMKTYYSQRAAAGITFTEPIYVSRSGITNRGCSFWSEENIDGWKHLVDEVKSKGGVIFASVSHGGRMSHPSFNGGVRPISASEVTPQVRIRSHGDIVDPVLPRGMTEDDISRVLDDFHNVARGIRAANFDGISLHGTSGCLVESFIKSGTNLRSDRWGGKGGLDFPVEIINRFKTEFDSDYICFKFSPFDNYNDMQEAHPLDKYTCLVDKIGKIGMYEFKETVEKGNDVNWRDKKETNTVKKQSQIISKQIKATGSKLISNFGTKNMRDAVDKIEKGECDFVSCATFYVSNPDLPNRLEKSLPLKTPNFSLYYSNGVEGYIDY